MTNDKRKALIDTLIVGLWVGGSALVTYVITALLDKPEFAAYYGLLNVLLVLVKNFKK